MTRARQCTAARSRSRIFASTQLTIRLREQHRWRRRAPWSLADACPVSFPTIRPRRTCQFSPCLTHKCKGFNGRAVLSARRRPMSVPRRAARDRSRYFRITVRSCRGSGADSPARIPGPGTSKIRSSLAIRVALTLDETFLAHSGDESRCIPCQMTAITARQTIECRCSDR